MISLALKKKLSPVDVSERASLDIKSGDTVRVSVKIQEKGILRA